MTLSRLLLSFVLIGSALVVNAQAPELPVDFETPGLTYFTDFGDATSITGEDPTDATNTVAITNKPIIAPTWSGTTIGPETGFVELIPITADATTMSVSVYSPDAGIQVRFKIEDSTDPTKSVETEATVTMANTWEVLVFDFANEAPGTAALNLAYNFDKASIFFNFGVDGETAGDKTYYWDNVVMGGEGNALDQMDLPVTFEDEMVFYVLTDFGGNSSMIVADPTDETNTVAMSTKPLGSELWAGTTAGNANGFANAIPLSATETVMSVRVYSPEAGFPVRLKIEDSGDPTHSVETEAVTTMANTWETLLFDFTNEAAGTAALNLDFVYDKASIFFNFGTTGDDAGELTFYWDDVQMEEGVIVLQQISLPVTFEDDMVEYGPTDFGGNVSEITADPTDGTNTVAMSTKPLGAELWAGSTMGNDAGFADIIPITATDTKMTVRVYSPAAGFPIRLKIEESGDPTHSVETEAMTTVADTWETLEFDFTNEAAGTAALNLDYMYDKASIFFNFGTTGDDAGELTFYWDDVEMFDDGITLDQITLPVTFEDEMVEYGPIDFGGNASEIVADPTDGTNTVAMSTKPLGAELWAGSTMGTDAGFADIIPITATDTKMTVRVYSPAAGFPIRLKIEESGDPTHSVETEAMTTAADTWETLEFDFANEAAGTAALNLDYMYDKASIFFNFGTTGDDAGELTFYWDDVDMFDDGITLDQITLPVTFEDEMVEYGPTDFGGNASEIVADPTDGTNTVAMTTKPLGAELWAGSTMGTDTGFAEVIPITASDTKMSVRVYSPAAGVPVRLKIEESGDPTHSVETEALTTVANTWETLEFDFTNEAAGTAALNLDYMYDKASIFFNFGTTGDDAGEQTYYWDDVEMVVGDNIASYSSISFVAYPNPVVDRLYITGAAQATSIVLMDLMGNKVLGLSPEENAEVNVSALSAGVYFLRVTQDGMTRTTRIVKQ